MEIYVALRDSDQPQSFVIGAFSTEERAQSACQAEADDIAKGWGKSFAPPLEWKDAEAASYMSTPVRGDTTRTGLVIEHLTRLYLSMNGNPRFRVYFTDGSVHQTMTDAGLGYEIENPEFRNAPLTVTFTARGRIRHATPEQATPRDYLSLPGGGALVERKECACGTSVTLFRGTWWNDGDTPHDCADREN